MLMGIKIEKKEQKNVQLSTYLEQHYNLLYFIFGSLSSFSSYTYLFSDGPAAA